MNVCPYWRGLRRPEGRGVRGYCDSAPGVLYVPSLAEARELCLKAAHDRCPRHRFGGDAETVEPAAVSSVRPDLVDAEAY